MSRCPVCVPIRPPCLSVVVAIVVVVVVVCALVCRCCCSLLSRLSSRCWWHVVVSAGVWVSYSISGLVPGVHGFHVHTWGNIGAANGSACGGHYLGDCNSTMVRVVVRGVVCCHRCLVLCSVCCGASCFC